MGAELICHGKKRARSVIGQEDLSLSVFDIVLHECRYGMPSVNERIRAVGHGIGYLETHIVIDINENTPADDLVFDPEADACSQPVCRHGKKPHGRRFGNGQLHFFKRLTACREESCVFIAVVRRKIGAYGDAEIGRSHFPHDGARIFHAEKRSEFVADIYFTEAVFEMLCINAEIKAAGRCGKAEKR